MTQPPGLKTQEMQVNGMDCGSCAKTIEASLRQLHGVTEASVNFATGLVKVSYDPKLLSEAEIINCITALGYTVDVTPAKKLLLQIAGMDCGSCAKTIEVGLQQIPGVLDVSLSFATERLQLSIDPQQVGEKTIYDRIIALGYMVEQSPAVSEHDHSHDHRHDHRHDHDHNHSHDHDQDHAHDVLGYTVDVAPAKKLQVGIGGMDCGSCAKTIEVGLQQTAGVLEASVSFATERSQISYDQEQVSEKTIYDRIKALGYTVYTVKQSPEVSEHNHTPSCSHNDHEHHHDRVEVADGKTLQVKVNGMDCGSCAKTIEVGLQQIPGVSNVLVNFATEQLQLDYDPQQISEKTIYDRVKALGYTVEQSRDISRDHYHQNTVTKTTQNNAPTNWNFWLTNRRGQSVILAGIGLVLGLLTQHLALPIWIARAFYGVGIVVAGYPIARAGLFELRLRRADMNLLMTISVIGAVILGDWFEATLVLFLFSVGTTLQVFTFGRTRNAIRSLMDLTPTTATVKRGNKEVTVPVESVGVGEILTIRPGQRVALDGVVVSGTSAVDQSPITGESIPEDKESGDTVYAGTLNQGGFLTVKVTHTSSDTTVAKIINLVEEAQGSRAPSQQWVDRFAEVYTPIVILIAILIAVIPPLAFAQPFNVWLYRALVMLVIACPCALVISTPVSIVSAIGAATRQGVLFKGGKALETAGRMNILAFDKTGTLTQGLPKVSKFVSLGETTSRQVLLIAASLEQQSEHPLAKAILSRFWLRQVQVAIPRCCKSSLASANLMTQRLMGMLKR